LRAFEAYKAVCERKEEDPDLDIDLWCSEHGLNKTSLDRVQSQMKPMEKFLKRAKIPLASAPLDDPVRLRRALVRGLCTQSAIYHNGHEYRTVYENTPALVSQHSSLRGAQHEWIVWTRFGTIEGPQTLGFVAAAEPAWLVVSLPLHQNSCL
jgi:hypothetical protein